jgi:hypothetical protein
MAELKKYPWSMWVYLAGNDRFCAYEGIIVGGVWTSNDSILVLPNAVRDLIDRAVRRFQRRKNAIL